MNNYTFLLICISLILFANQSRASGIRQVQKFDVVIYGATSAGIAAAIQSSRMEKSVLLIEPGSRIGGLTTGGLGRTDIGNKKAIGGIAREFYHNIWKYYNLPEHWAWEKREDYFQTQATGIEVDTDAMWAFEPQAALKVYKEMLAPEKVTLVYSQRLDRTNGVIRDGSRIRQIRMENGAVYEGKMFIDATYEGDLMAAAKVSYTYGRESNQEYGETLNGVQTNRMNLSLKGGISKNAWNHNFVPGVDPYVVKGDKSSGLLPFISPEKPGLDGSGDKKIQAFCFRMTLTDHPENRIPFGKPPHYDELDYELLFRNYEAAPNGKIEEMYDYGDPILPWINAKMPNRKTDTNNQKGFSTDFIGQNYLYPEAGYAEREKMIQNHLAYQKGLMWTLAYHPRIPEKVREQVSKWGTCKDEYDGKDGWQQQLYIREARRMVSDYVMTQRNCEGIDIAKDAIGLGAYGMDSHHTQRYVDVNGYVQNEGNVECSVQSPYPISYRSIVPRQTECTNLLVPVCLSATHIAFGSIRMEPVFMVLGQSSAIAASIAIDKKIALQEIPYQELRKTLLRYDQRLEWTGNK